MPISDVFGLTQHLLYGSAIEKTSLVGPPIFVLGHWRSGTTLLHELLALDQRYASPTTYQCFAPWHFLLTEGIITKYGEWLIPNKRPMDNMKAGWSLPQEDEFALMNLGAPTPYLRMMFPQHSVPFQETLSSERFPQDELASWKHLLHWFLKALTYKTHKPLILKSPPHTGRLGILKEMFPDAKFVHIVRDPRKLFPSTVKLWKSLDEVQAVQSHASEAAIERFVLDALKIMYQSFTRDQASLPSHRFAEVRYEDLAADPTEVVRQVYEQLELKDFASISSRLRDRTTTERNYQTNRFQLSPEKEAMVLAEWSDYATRYGYA
jgi:omega-hydroxy-beta-dihydromenaquinone-9 sulfotransferase